MFFGGWGRGKTGRGSQESLEKLLSPQRNTLMHLPTPNILQELQGAHWPPCLQIKSLVDNIYPPSTNWPPEVPWKPIMRRDNPKQERVPLQMERTWVCSVLLHSSLWIFPQRNTYTRSSASRDACTHMPSCWCSCFLNWENWKLEKTQRQGERRGRLARSRLAQVPSIPHSGCCKLLSHAGCFSSLSLNWTI